MKLFGLIGQSLTHSYSANYFTQKFAKEKFTDCRYNLYPLQSLNQLNELVKTNQQLIGFNVTIPFKETIIPFLDDLDETAMKIQAVNTVCIFREGLKYFLKGFNTDVYGFKNSVDFPEKVKKALILGTGGAAKAVAFALSTMGISTIFVSRNPLDKHSIYYQDLKLEHFQEYQLIVNATPVGMFPDIKSYPVLPYHFIQSGNILYDLVYNPAITRFMQFGMEKGATVFNGLKMLELQAEESWKIWNSMDCFDLQ